MCGSRAKRSRVLQLGRGESFRGKEISTKLEKEGDALNVPATPVEFGKWALRFPNVERNPSLENLCCSCWAAESIVISFRCDTPLCDVVRGGYCAIDTPCDAKATHGSDPDTPARCALHKNEDMKVIVPPLYPPCSSFHHAPDLLFTFSSIWVRRLPLPVVGRMLCAESAGSHTLSQ